MKKKNKKVDVYYQSMSEFEEKLLPNFYEEKLTMNKIKEPKTYGTGFAIELLEDIKEEIND